MMGTEKERTAERGREIKKRETGRHKHTCRKNREREKQMGAH